MNKKEYYIPTYINILYNTCIDACARRKEFAISRNVGLLEDLGNLMKKMSHENPHWRFRIKIGRIYSRVSSTPLLVYGSIVSTAIVLLIVLPLQTPITCSTIDLLVYYTAFKDRQKFKIKSLMLFISFYSIVESDGVNIREISLYHQKITEIAFS